jgi:hypothetical protein
MFQMTFTVSDETLKRTTHCQLALQCLSNEDGPSCEVKHAEGLDSVLFLRKGTDAFCYYFEANRLCTCPVRIELFKRYGI